LWPKVQLETIDLTVLAFDILKDDALAPLISIVGSDGSGKSTVSAEVLGFVRRYGVAETAYLGLKSGDMGQKIKTIPLIGQMTEAYLARKAAQARNRQSKIPGPMTALVIYTLSLVRISRFKRMLARRRDGIIIVTDRYPQTDVAGFYDGPGLSAARAEGRFVRWLAEKERAKYEWMAAHRPDLVIRLNVDVETAFARKPDHALEALRVKVEVTPKLRFGGAPIHDIDSRLPLEQVVASARSAIAKTMKQLGRPSIAT
jgi:thymidylate kinase